MSNKLDKIANVLGEAQSIEVVSFKTDDSSLIIGLKVQHGVSVYAVTIGTFPCFIHMDKIRPKKDDK